MQVNYYQYVIIFYRDDKVYDYRSEGRHTGLPLRFFLAIPDTKTVYNFDKYRILAILSSFNPSRSAAVIHAAVIQVIFINTLIKLAPQRAP